jgi:hypothetical protein
MQILRDDCDSMEENRVVFMVITVVFDLPSLDILTFPSFISITFFVEAEQKPKNISFTLSQVLK